MTQQPGEQISALLDGEIPGRQYDRAVTQLVSGGATGLAQFGRYRLIGEVLRGERVALTRDLARSVHEALSDEPAIIAPVRGRAPWRRPLAGVAVAASLAAVAILVAPGLLGTGTPGAADPAPRIVAAPSGGTAPVATLVNASAGDPAPATQGLDVELTDRLNQLVIEHHEFGGRTGVHGPVAHIGLVSYERR